jgi:hypothetical protein
MAGQRKRRRQREQRRGHHGGRGGWSPGRCQCKTAWQVQGGAMAVRPGSGRWRGGPARRKRRQWRSG